MIRTQHIFLLLTPLPQVVESTPSDRDYVLDAVKELLEQRGELTAYSLAKHADISPELARNYLTHFNTAGIVSAGAKIAKIVPPSGGRPRSYRVYTRAKG